MENLTHKIEDYINYQNKSLWEELYSEYDIELFHDPTEFSWLVEIKGKKAKIVCDNLEINYASFTHELLHIKLDQLGMTNFNELSDYTSNHLIFKHFIFRSMIYNVFNFHSHKKMFPYFDSMGFNDVDFVSNTENFSFIESLRLRIFPKIKLLKSCGMEEFLGKFFALKNDFIQSNSIRKERYLKRLRKINTELFDIAEQFDSEWNERNDFDYIASLEIFTENLKPYLSEKYGR